MRPKDRIKSEKQKIEIVVAVSTFRLLVLLRKYFLDLFLNFLNSVKVESSPFYKIMSKVCFAAMSLSIGLIKIYRKPSSNRYNTIPSFAIKILTSKHRAFPF